MFDRNLVRYARSQRVLFFLTIAFALLTALLTLAQAWLLSAVIARVFLQDAALQEVASFLFLLACVVGVRAIVHSSGEYTASTLAVRVKTDLRALMMEKIRALGPAYVSGERTGELTNTAIEGVEALDAYFAQYLPQLVIAALVPLAIVLTIFPIDFLSAFVLLVTAPLIPFFMLLIGNAADALTKRQFNRLSLLSAQFLDVLQGLTTLKLLNASKAVTASIRAASDEYARATLSVLRVAFLSAFVLELIATLSTAVVAVEIGLRVLYNQMSFQPALFILILAPEFYIPLRMLGLRYHAAASGTAASKRILEILDAPLSSFPSASRQVVSPPRVIAFQNVSYVYADERAALRDVSFALRAGETVALFGPSGAGKTTLANLLLGFMNPARGEILIDGVPLREMDLDAWRAQIAYVPQQPYLFHDTIRRNIALGRPDASQAEIERAARAAHLHEFIMSLPDAYETPVGENAARLSGGQAPRLALARAFLLNAPVLILDEPTSNIDPDTEAQLFESTQALMRNKTTLLIAHRLATMYRADRIIVLENGQVRDTGRHAELLERAGPYRNLIMAGAPDA